MGPKNLHSDFICRNLHHKRDGKWIHNITDIPGRIGVDLSIIMHRKMGTKSGAAVFDMQPEVPLYDALQAVMKDLRFLRQTCGREVTVFFDGKSHPMKGGEEIARQQARELALDDLQTIYKEALPGSFETVKKLRTKIVHRREDFSARIARESVKVGVRVVCAPFETDWQMVEAQRAGFIDLIVSNDGDLFVLGADKIISELNYHTGACCY